MDRGRVRGLIGMWRPHFSRRAFMEGAAVAVLLIFAFSATRRPGIVGPSQHRSGGRCSFPAIFNFGDSNSDTGGLSAAFHRLHLPNGVTFFGGPSGRYCDGKLMIDFIADKLGLPYLHAYLDSIGANFQHGANFATSASTIEPLDARMFQQEFSPISLGIQLEQFEQFKARTLELHSRGSSYAKSSLPRPEDFAKALYTMDIGQNDLHSSLGSMTQKQVLELIPNITALFAQAVEEFNRQLKDWVSKLRLQYPDAKLNYIDIYSAKYSLISEAKKHGFADPLTNCCGRFGDNGVPCGEKAVVNGTEVFGAPCEDPLKVISWDAVHYSHAANEWVATRILDGSFSDIRVPMVESCPDPSSP